MLKRTHEYYLQGKEVPAEIRGAVLGTSGNTGQDYREAEEKRRKIAEFNAFNAAQAMLVA